MLNTSVWQLAMALISWISSTTIHVADSQDMFIRRKECIVKLATRMHVIIAELRTRSLATAQHDQPHRGQQQLMPYRTYSFSLAYIKIYDTSTQGFFLLALRPFHT